MADGLSSVGSEHSVGGGSVDGSLVLKDELRTEDVSNAWRRGEEEKGTMVSDESGRELTRENGRTVSDKDHGRGHRSLGVPSDVGRNHDEPKSEADGLTVDQPEPNESGPGLREGKEGHQARSQDTDEVSDSDLRRGKEGVSNVARGARDGGKQKNSP